MNIRTLLYAVTLATGFTATSAQLNIGNNFTKDAFDKLSGALSAVECEDETRAGAQCMLTPFSGTYVCRKFGSIFGGTVEHTMCAQNVVEGFTLGVKDDQCGCCANEDGEKVCPPICTTACTCDEGKVSVDVHVLGFIKFKRCVTNGWAKHSTTWGNAVKCTETCEDVTDESTVEDGDGQ